MTVGDNTSFVTYFKRSFRKIALEAMGMLAVIAILALIAAFFFGDVPRLQFGQFLLMLAAIIAVVVIGGLVLSVQIAYVRWLRDQREAEDDYLDNCQ